MKGLFLRTVRFDASDGHAFPAAAEPDEWAVSGAFAFAGGHRDALTGKARQAFANGFLGLTTFGRATFTTVARMTDADRGEITNRLTRHLLDAYGAPGESEARRAADEEIAFIEDLVSDSLINTLFCVSRTLDDAGNIHEAFRKLERRVDGGPIYLADEEGNNDAG